MEIPSEKAASRQAIYDQLWDEYEEEHSHAFVLAWNGETTRWGELRDEFMEDYAQRAEGMSLQAYGVAIAGPVPPDDWYERERPTWIGALQCLGIDYLHERDRAKLVATAELLGLRKVVHRGGVAW